jgi:hypothetical protein
MNRRNKIILVALLSILVLCVFSCCLIPSLLNGVINSRFSEDPAVVKKLSQDMFDYQLPPGYTQTSADFWGVLKMIVITPSGNSNFMMGFIQSSTINQANQSEFISSLTSSNASGGSNITWHAAGFTQTIVKGAVVNMTVNEGVDADGVAYREMTGVINGRSAPVILIARGQTAYWDQAGFYALIRSIK